MGYKYYMGRTKPMPKEYEGTDSGLLWIAEKAYSETGRLGSDYDLQSWVCAFVGKWEPYHYGQILLGYLSDSPHLTQLRKIYEF